MPVITLTTDFGLKDGFAGTLKGVIWSICPEARIADITHSVSPQNILEGALVLERAWQFFPSGTIHLAVVDPGVGTQRRPLAMQVGEGFFVGPDNGLFTPLFESAEKNGWPMEIIHLTNPKYWLPQVSPTFHGRDIFAPVAAHLANGVPLPDLGLLIKDPLRIQLPKPERTSTGWRAHVVGIDAFGNLAPDLTAGWLLKPESVVLRIGRHQIHGILEAYGQRPAGELIALADSEGRLELAVVNGSAAQRTGAQVGDGVEVEYDESVVE